MNYQAEDSSSNGQIHFYGIESVLVQFACNIGTEMILNAKFRLTSQAFVTVLTL